MLKKLKKIALAATLVAIHAVGQAEDIDLFAGAPVAADVPNVLIVIDNTANWSSAFAAEMAALAVHLGQRRRVRDPVDVGVAVGALPLAVHRVPDRGLVDEQRAHAAVGPHGLELLLAVADVALAGGGCRDRCGLR